MRRHGRSRGRVGRSRRARIVALLVVAGIGAGGIAAYAAVPSTSGIVTSCYKDGKVRIVDAEAGETCRPSETELSWAQGRVVAAQTAFVPLGGTFAAGGQIVETLTVPPGVYHVSATATVLTTAAQRTTCWLVFDGLGDDAPIDQSRGTAPVVAGEAWTSHALESVLFVPAELQLKCATNEAWSAEHVSIVAVPVAEATLDGAPVE